MVTSGSLHAHAMFESPSGISVILPVRLDLVKILILNFGCELFACLLQLPSTIVDVDD